MTQFEEPHVNAFLAAQLPSSWTAEELHLELELGAEGIGLDSIGLVELVVTVEDHFKIVLPIDDFFEQEPTVGLLLMAIHDELAKHADSA